MDLANQRRPTHTISDLCMFHLNLFLLSQSLVAPCSVQQLLQRTRTIYIGSVLAIPGDVLVAQQSFVPSILQLLVMSMTAVNFG